jgi:hypothetical protein
VECIFKIFKNTQKQQRNEKEKKLNLIYVCESREYGSIAFHSLGQAKTISTINVILYWASKSGKMLS